MEQPRKVLLFGDIVIPSGFGRIGAAVGRYLVASGYQVMGVCVQYDGLLPYSLPFFVAGVNGKDFGQTLSGISSWFRPDVVVSLQDFPYHDMAHHATGIDWSTTAHVGITPVDGLPIYSKWLNLVPKLDGFMTISEFGVQGFKDAGVKAELCPPGVDTNEFKRLPDDTRVALRAKLGIPAEGFVVGMMAMNQGRKDFPAMIEGFWKGLKDIPNAYLFLDCEKVSPAGWDIPDSLLRVLGVDPARIRFKEDAQRNGVIGLNERYNLLDLHAVIAHREGFGLPHVEAMATGIPSMAIDYCSGREIIGMNERGCLIKAIPGRIGTWGGAQDYNADIDDLATQLRQMVDQPEERKARGARALAWAQKRTWGDMAARVEKVISRAIDKRAGDLARKNGLVTPPTMPQQQQSTAPAGLNPQIVINGNVFVQAQNPGEMGEKLTQLVESEKK